MRYFGSIMMRDDVQTQCDPLLLRGNHRLADITIRTQDSNYALHSERANVERNWLQVIDDRVLRHDGNEGAWNRSRANGGAGITAGTRWTAAIGVGMSSGARLEIRRTRATSLKGGGSYVHNTPGQAASCSLLVEDCSLGGETPIADDIVLHQLGSPKGDTALLRRVNFGNGLFFAGD